jgi:hypothetical protein
MTARWLLPALLVLGALGCAARAPRALPEAVYTQAVEQQLLAPASTGSGAAPVQRYTPQPFERFRMPRALQAPQPRLAPDAAARELAPTRVCARVAIGADGSVMFADALTTRSECAAGGEPANAALVTAMLEAVRGWRFRPAALCRYGADALQDGDDDADADCAGALQVEPVPVTLEYGFTFHVHAGRVEVRRDGGGGS